MVPGGLTTASQGGVTPSPNQLETMNPDRFNVGIEVEYPTVANGADPMTSYGHDSGFLVNALQQELGEAPGGRRWPLGGDIASDVSVGLELQSAPEGERSGGISIGRARDWYPESLDMVRDFEQHAPVGLMDRNNQTAGLHIHFSDPSDDVGDFAEWLADVSQEEWMRVFACSSLVEQNGPTAFPVFRGTRHVHMSYDRGRQSVVHSVSRSAGHYEWRLPEPMTEENFDLLMEFLDRAVSEGRDEAAEWAREIVYSGDERLTSVQRANALSLDSFEPPTNIDGLQVIRGADSTTHSFHDYVYESGEMPYIYRVTTEDGRYADTYYVMVSTMRPPSDYDVPDGYAHLFEGVPDDTRRWVVEQASDGLTLADPETTEEVIDVANTRREERSSRDDPETTAATDVLLDALDA